MFRFPAEVDGWLLRSEGEALHDWAIGNRILEIGSYCGRSTICLAQSAKEVVSIDTHDGRSVGLRNTLPKFLSNLEEWRVSDAVTVLVGDVEEVRPSGVFDGVFIDGCHQYQSVKRDAGIAESVLSPHGQLAFHDYWRGDPGVVKAVDELLESGAKLLRVVDRIAFVKARKE